MSQGYYHQDGPHLQPQAQPQPVSMSHGQFPPPHHQSKHHKHSYQQQPAHTSTGLPRPSPRAAARPGSHSAESPSRGMTLPSGRLAAAPGPSLSHSGNSRTFAAAGSDHSNADSKGSSSAGSLSHYMDNGYRYEGALPPHIRDAAQSANSTVKHPLHQPQPVEQELPGGFSVVPQSYVMQHELGSGGAGKAFLVSGKMDGKRYVAKQIICLGDKYRPAPASYALHETRLLFLLQHPHIVALRDFYPKSANYFIVMEYCENGDLGQHMDEATRRGGAKFEAQQVFNWWYQMLDGVDYCHSKGVIHRDLKPKNVFLDGRLNIKIGDFGVAALTSFPPAMERVGTPAYHSPEVSSALNYSPASDVWSVGCIMWEVMTLQPHGQQAVNLQVINLTHIPRSYGTAARDLLIMHLQKDMEGRPSAASLKETMLQKLTQAGRHYLHATAESTAAQIRATNHAHAAALAPCSVTVPSSLNASVDLPSEASAPNGLRTPPNGASLGAPTSTDGHSSFTGRSSFTDSNRTPPRSPAVSYASLPPNSPAASHVSLALHADDATGEIGLQLAAGEGGEYGAWRVVGVDAGKPAAQAGLTAGEYLWEVDGKVIFGMTYPLVAAMFRQRPEHDVRLGLKSGLGLPTRHVTLPRAPSRAHSASPEAPPAAQDLSRAPLGLKEGAGGGGEVGGGAAGGVGGVEGGGGAVGEQGGGVAGGEQGGGGGGQQGEGGGGEVGEGGRGEGGKQRVAEEYERRLEPGYAEAVEEAQRVLEADLTAAAHVASHVRAQAEAAMSAAAAAVRDLPPTSHSPEDVSQRRGVGGGGRSPRAPGSPRGILRVSPKPGSAEPQHAWKAFAGGSMSPVAGLPRHSPTANGAAEGAGSQLAVQGTATIAGDGEYVGVLVDGRPFGHGTATWPNQGHTYVGEWLDGVMHGQGTATYLNGDRYDGEWSRGKRSGLGRYAHGSGDVYEGLWANERKHGLGVDTFADGRRYRGQFKDNKFAGLGAYFTAEGAIYQGDWHQGKAHGTGFSTSTQGAEPAFVQYTHGNLMSSDAFDPSAHREQLARVEAQSRAAIAVALLARNTASKIQAIRIAAPTADVEGIEEQALREFLAAQGEESVLAKAVLMIAGIRCRERDDAALIVDGLEDDAPGALAFLTPGDRVVEVARRSCSWYKKMPLDVVLQHLVREGGTLEIGLRSAGAVEGMPARRFMLPKREQGFIV